MGRPAVTHKDLSIGEVARRSGLSITAIRFYEAKGLIESRRNPGNQRRFRRDVLRRVAIIMVAQSLGIPLAEIRRALDALPEGRAPTAADWQRLSAAWQAELDGRIERLHRLREQLGFCRGCGCLSLAECPLRLEAAGGVEEDAEAPQG